MTLLLAARPRVALGLAIVAILAVPTALAPP